MPDAAAAATAANIPEAADAELNGWLSCFMGDGPGLAEGLWAEAGGGSGCLWCPPLGAVFPLGDVEGAAWELEVVTIPEKGIRSAQPLARAKFF